MIETQLLRSCGVISMPLISSTTRTVSALNEGCKKDFTYHSAYYTTFRAYILNMEMLGLGFGLTLAVGIASISVASIVALVRFIG